MGHALIWVETLAAALLAVALVAAVAAGRSNRWSRWLPAGVFAFGVFTVALVGTLALGLMARSGMVVPGKVWFAATWTAAFAIGALFILSRGLRPNTEGVPPARSWPRGRLAAGVAAALVLDAITVTNLDLALKVQLAAERAEAGAKIAALAPPPVPDRDNAAPVYQQAFAALRLNEANSGEVLGWLDRRKPFDPLSPEVAAVLRDREPGLALLRRAAGMSVCRFERDYHFPGPGSLELTSLLTASGLLALDARVRAARGEARTALDDVAALFGMARHTDEPILVMLMAALALDRRAVETLQEVLERSAPGAAELAVVRPGEVSFQQGFRRAHQVNSAAGLSAFVALSGGGEAEDIWWLFPNEPANSVSVRFFMSPLYRVFFMADELAAHRRKELTVQMLAWRQYYQARIDWEAEARTPRPGGLWAGGRSFSWHPVAVQVAAADARHRLAQLALAAEAYRIKTGKLPDQLDALVPDYMPAIPTDPCSGTPIRAKRDDKTLILYSVGPDGVDDGGVASVKRPGADQGDVAFRLTDR